MSNTPKPWPAFIRFPAEVKTWLEGRAKKNHRNKTGELRAIVAAAMAADEAAEKAALREAL